MIPEHKYIRPQSISETLADLDTNENNTRIIAGGTDIIPGFHIESARFRRIKKIIDLQDIKELREINKVSNEIHIGSAVTFSKIFENAIIKSERNLLEQAASTVGSAQIRNRATIGGNFINNAPCADSVPPLLVYDARIVIESLKNVNELPLKEFLIKPYATRLKQNELVTKIILPQLDKTYFGRFYKLGRRRGVAISRISLAVLMSLKGDLIKDFRIASGAVTPIGMRFTNIEKFAKGKKADTPLFIEIAQKIGKEILDVTGLRWSSLYKLPVVQQKVYQLIEEIFEEAKAA
jgi:xanthine dehydrogenase FAD-binding subunit